MKIKLWNFKNILIILLFLVLIIHFVSQESTFSLVDKRENVDVNIINTETTKISETQTHIKYLFSWETGQLDRQINKRFTLYIPDKQLESEKQDTDLPDQFDVKPDKISIMGVVEDSSCNLVTINKKPIISCSLELNVNDYGDLDGSLEVSYAKKL
jgi:hypothetical protein